MAFGPKKRRAARKKKNKKKKNTKTSYLNPHAEKVFAEGEAVPEMVTSDNEDNESSGSVVTVVNESGESSYHEPATIANPGEKFSHDPTAMANPDLSDCVANGDRLSLESDLEAISLRLHVKPLDEHLNARSTMSPEGAEKVAADVKLPGSISNVFVSEMIAVGDVISQPFSEIGSNENGGYESPQSCDNQNTFKDVLIEASLNKTEGNKTCESVVNDEVKVQKSLIKTSDKAGRNKQFESADHQTSLNKSTVGPTSLVKSTSNETEGNEGGDVGKSSCYPTTMANLVESDVTDGDQISPESDIDGVSINVDSTILPAEKNGDLHAEAVSEMCLKEKGGSESYETNESSDSAITDEVVLEDTLVETTLNKAEAYDPLKSVDEQIVLEEPLVEPFITETKKYKSLDLVGDQNNLQESLIEPTLSKVDITECGEMFLESALEGLSLRSPVHPPREHINESSPVLLTGESVINDEVKVEESLIKTSKITERDESFETVDLQISLDKSVIGPTSYETEKNESDGDQISPAHALKGVSTNASSTIPPAEKKVAADVELFESVRNASEVSVGNLNTEAVSEMCSNENEGRESDEGYDQINSHKFLTKTFSKTVETNESSEPVITDEVALEATLVETASKMAEAYDPEFVGDQNNLQESLTDQTLSKADITECGETFSREQTATATQVLLNVTTGDEKSLECALGGPSLEQQVHPLPEPPKRPRRNITRPIRYKDYHVSPMVKPKKRK